MDDNLKVRLIPINIFPRIVRCVSSSVSHNDWDILQMNPTSVEDCLLSQVSVIWKGMELPVWVNGIDKLAKLRVDDVEIGEEVDHSTEEGFGVLYRGSEVIVAPYSGGLLYSPSLDQQEEEEGWQGGHHLRVIHKSSSPTTLSNSLSVFVNPCHWGGNELERGDLVIVRAVWRRKRDIPHIKGE